MNITVNGLYHYPVKSCRGIALPTATIGRMGILFDRQWMVVDAKTGMFVAQRSSADRGVAIKSICLVVPSIQETDLTLEGPGMSPLSLPLSGHPGNNMRVQVWSSNLEAVDQGDEAARWFTDFLSQERPGSYRLVRMPDHGKRPSKYGGEADVGFADAVPFLIISEASLADLNNRLDEPLPMNRFRPNIVLLGCNPYAEDQMERLRINGIEFLGKALCVRCPTTATNQFTAERGKEPLKTLATYRKREMGVVFGKNFNHTGEGVIPVGAVCEVLEWAQE